MSYSLAVIGTVFIFLAQIAPDEQTALNRTLMGQGFILLTTIAGFLFQAYRENRARRWQQEDAAKLAVKVEEKAAAIEVKVVERAAIVAGKLEEKSEVVAEKLHEEAVELQAKHEKISRHVGAGVAQVVVNKAAEADIARDALSAKIDLIAGDRNPDGTPKTLKVEVVNEDANPVPTEVVEKKEK